MNRMSIKYPALLLTMLVFFLVAGCGGPGGGVPDLDGTEWGLSEMNGEALPGDVDINITFSEGQVSGQSACNRYFAEYTQDGSKLSIGLAGSTQMYCEGLMDYETDYLQALAEVESFELSGDSLKLLDQAGNAILVFRK